MILARGNRIAIREYKKVSHLSSPDGVQANSALSVRKIRNNIPVSRLHEITLFEFLNEIERNGNLEGCIHNISYT